jgi:hypothetical protein
MDLEIGEQVGTPRRIHSLRSKRLQSFLINRHNISAYHQPAPLLQRFHIGSSKPEIFICLIASGWAVFLSAFCYTAL